MFTRAVILGAGEGSRMGPLTRTLPKALLPKIEKSLLKWQIEFLKDYGIEVMVTVGYMKDLVSSAAMTLGADGFIDTSNQGNAYFLNLIPRDTADLLVITCDNIMTIDLEELSKEFTESSCVGMVVPVKPTDVVLGDRLKVDGKIVLSCDYESGDSVIASGLQVLDLTKLPSNTGLWNDFHDLWNELISSHSLQVAYQTPSSWLPVDTPEQLEKFIEINRE